MSSIPEDRKLDSFPSISVNSMIKALKLIAIGESGQAGELFFNQFKFRKFQRVVDSGASDQFPLRFQGILLVKAVERAQIALAYLFLPDAAIPTDMVSGIYIMRDGSLFFLGPAKSDSNTLVKLDNRIDYYEDLIEKNPDIRFYAYHIERIENTAYHPLNEFFSDLDEGRNLEYFEKRKPEELRLGKLTFNGLEEYKELNYHTDHHWNIHGALKAYDEIYQMLTSDFPDISPAIVHDNFQKFPDIDFYGSFAGRTLHPCQPDEFEISVLNLPDYEVFIDGKEVEPEINKKYLEGNYSRAKYAHHYNYFGTGLPGSVYEYVFNNNSSRNLLIVGNSYKWPIYPLLAYHYQHTYSVNLIEQESFSVAKFIKEHAVDDVLFVGDSDALFMLYD